MRRARRTRINKNARMLLGITALFFFGGLWAVPMVLQQSSVLQACLRHLNRESSGSLQVESCTVGWVRGLECRGLRFDLPAQGVQVQAKTLHSDKGILAFVFAPHYLGELTLDHPTIMFTRQVANAAPSEASTSQGEDAGKRQTEPADRLRQQPIRWWERTAFRLRVFEGSAFLQREADPPLELASAIALAGSLAEGTVTYALNFQSGPVSGQVRAEGFLNLPSDRVRFLEGLVSKTELTITNVELAPFLELGAVRAHLPTGSGLLDANLHVDTAGLAEIKVLGDVQLADLSLAGGFLGQDKPVFDSIRLAFNSSRKHQEGWRLTTLKLESAPLRFDAQGQVDAQTVSIQAKGAVNLPVLAKQIPQTLLLDENTELQEGNLDFSLGLTGTPQQIRVRADCLTSALKISSNGQPFQWQAPLKIALKGGYEPGQVKVDTLQVTTPFLEVTGSGDSGGYTLKATADLEQMSQELHKLFAVDYAGKGKLTAEGLLQPKEDNSGRRLDLRGTISGFELLHQGKTVVPVHDFGLQGHVAATGLSFRQWRLEQLALDTTFWPGRIVLTANNDQPAVQSSPLVLHASANLDLAKTIVLGRALEVPLPPGQWQGDLALAADATLEYDQTILHNLAATVQGLQWQTGGDPLKQSSLVLALDKSAAAGNNEKMAVRELVIANDWQEYAAQDKPFIRVDWKHRSIDWRHLQIRSEDLVLQTNASWHDWRQPRQNFRFAGNTKAQASLLVKLLNSTGMVPREVAAQGDVQVEVELQSQGDESVLGDLSLQSDNLTLFQGNKKLNTDRKLALKTSFKRNSTQEDAADLTSCTLRTPLFRAEGSGRLQWAESKPVLVVQGQCLPNYEILSSKLASSTRLPLTLTGTKSGSFQLTLPLGSSQDLQAIRWMLTLPVESLRWKNVEIKKIELPLAYSKETLQAELAADFSGGKLALQPRWHLSAANTGMVIPATRVLTGVTPTPTFTGEVLAYLHPLLGVLASPAGALDLQLKQFAVPLQPGPALSPMFSVVVELAEPSLQPKGILKELLDMSGFGGKELRLQQRTLTCKGSDGRIVCDPVVLRAGEKTIKLKAVTGLDGSIDYGLQWPLTRPSLGEGKGDAVPEETVKVAITGTLAAPRYNRQEFQANVRALVNQTPQAPPPARPEPTTPAPSGGT